MDTLNDWVLVIPEESEQQFTPGGLTLPESMQKPLLSGMVVGICDPVVLSNGRGVYHDVKPGDVVYWLKNYGWKYSEGGTSYVLLRYGELVGMDQVSPREVE